MAQGQGYKAWLGTGVQTVLGTLVSRTKYLDFISESMKVVPQRKQWNNAGQTALRINTDLGRHSEGSIEIYGAFEGLETLMKAVFGDASETIAQVSGTAYSHSYALKDAMPTPGLSLEINKDITSFLFEACKVEEVEFQQDANEYLKVRFTLRGRNETRASASSPTFLGVLKVHSSQLTVKIATVATAVDSYRLTLKNNMTGFRGQLNASPDSKEFIRGNKRSVAGSITMDFADQTRYDEFRNLTNTALEFKYVGDAISGGSGELYQFKLNVAQANWEGDTPNIGGSGPISLNLPFTAFETTRGGNDEMTAFIQNTLTS